MKQCSKCGESKPLNEYYKDRTKPDGTSPKCKNCKKLYEQVNKETIRVKNSQNLRNRRKDNIEFRLIDALASALYRCYNKKGIEGRRTKDTIEQYLGCTIPEFKIHIENQFKEGMSWNNHGHWHLDHIIPIMSLEKEEYTIEQVQHHTNFQPLWAKENMKKTLTDMEKYWLD